MYANNNLHFSHKKWRNNHNFPIFRIKMRAINNLILKNPKMEYP